jgi:hypothetical protein
MIDAEELRYRALETQGMLDEMEWLKEQGEYSILTPVEHRVVLLPFHRKNIDGMVG